MYRRLREYLRHKEGKGGDPGLSDIGLDLRLVWGSKMSHSTGNEYHDKTVD
jgi:hypothetical protein